MLGSGILRGQQQEDQIGGLTVDRLEIYWRAQPHEESGDGVDPSQAGVRDRDALADTGRAKAFTLQHSFKNGARIESCGVRCRFRHGLEDLLSTGRTEINGGAAIGNQIC